MPSARRSGALRYDLLEEAAHQVAGDLLAVGGLLSRADLLGGQVPGPFDEGGVEGLPHERLLGPLQASGDGGHAAGREAQDPDPVLFELQIGGQGDAGEGQGLSGPPFEECLTGARGG